MIDENDRRDRRDVCDDPGLVNGVAEIAVHRTAPANCCNHSRTFSYSYRRDHILASAALPRPAMTDLWPMGGRKSNSGRGSQCDIWVTSATQVTQDCQLIVKNIA